MRAALALAALLAAAPAHPQDLAGADLRDEVSGNTLSGIHTGGVVFSEYHSPDGRVFGFNNGEPVVEGCWDVRRDSVCYYYAQGAIKGTFCWRMIRAGPNGYRIRSIETPAVGIARLARGNPQNHTDGGRPWTCEPLSSSLERPLRLSRR
ncbi:MAG TPA: hypothetical protein VEA41_16060 [Salinarimonas sp.]|jgi:hypothetical protein|nr:hypothetical protein [Salinarimonas sp.]